MDYSDFRAERQLKLFAAGDPGNAGKVAELLERGRADRAARRAGIAPSDPQAIARLIALAEQHTATIYPSTIARSTGGAM